MVLKRPDGYVPAGKLRHDFNDLTLAPSPLMSHKVFVELARRAGKGITEDEARRAAEHVSQLYLLHGGRLRSSELREVLRTVLGFEVPEEVIRSYFGFERAYVLLKLKPQADVSAVIEEVVNWPEVEAVDEVYGDADLIVVGKVAMGPDNLVERLRRRYQGVVEEMKVLITD
jgi:DNA-binding Lrp family transcriptional regulator